MKKLALIVAFLAFTTMSFAATTSESNMPVPGNSTHSKALREHAHDYVDLDTDTQNTSKRKDFVAGAGVNVKLFDFNKVKSQARLLNYLDSVNVETKWDFVNKDLSTFLVVDIDLTSLWQ